LLVDYFTFSFSGNVAGHGFAALFYGSMPVRALPRSPSLLGGLQIRWWPQPVLFPSFFTRHPRRIKSSFSESCGLFSRGLGPWLSLVASFPLYQVDPPTSHSFFIQSKFAGIPPPLPVPSLVSRVQGPRFNSPGRNFSPCGAPPLLCLFPFSFLTIVFSSFLFWTFHKVSWFLPPSTFPLP